MTAIAVWTQARDEIRRGGLTCVCALDAAAGAHVWPSCRHSSTLRGFID